MAETAGRSHDADLPSRRGLLALLAGASLAAHAVPSAASKKQRKHRKRKTKEKGNGSPQPTERLDAVCDAPNRDSGRTLTVDGRLAQTFPALTTGDLVRAVLLIAKDGNTFGDYVLQLNLTNATGKPANVVLATSFVADETVPAGTSSVTFTFASPARVIANHKFALVLSRPGTTEFAWLGNGLDACSGINAVSLDFTSPFVVEAGSRIDLHFKTFVRA